VYSALPGDVVASWLVVCWQNGASVAVLAATVSLPGALLTHDDVVYSDTCMAPPAQLTFAYTVDTLLFNLLRYGTHDAVPTKYVVVRGNVVDVEQSLVSYSLMRYPLGTAKFVVDVGGTTLGYALHVDA